MKLLKNSIQLAAHTKGKATKKKSSDWTLIDIYLDKIKNEIFNQFRSFLYTLLVSFIVLDVVALMLWLNNTGSLEETINGTQLFLLVFITPLALSFINATGGVSCKQNRDAPLIKSATAKFAASIFLSLCFSLGVFLISHWNQDWMDIFVEIYSAPFYFLSILLLSVVSFTLAFSFKKTAPALLFSIPALGTIPLALGSATLLMYSGSLSPLALRRSAEILNNFWVENISFVLFIYCLLGSVAFFVCERNLQNEINNTRFRIRISQLLVCWPVVVYSVFHIGMLVLVVLRYRIIMTIVRTGHGFLL